MEAMMVKIMINFTRQENSSQPLHKETKFISISRNLIVSFVFIWNIQKAKMRHMFLKSELMGLRPIRMKKNYVRERLKIS